MCLNNTISQNKDYNENEPDLLDLLDEDHFTYKSDYVDIDAVTNKLNSKSGLTVMHFNIHGLLSKIHELELMLYKLDKLNRAPDVILLCETFLNKQNMFLANLKGYTCHHNVRDNMGKGGITIYVRNGIKHMYEHELVLWDEGKLETSFIKVTDAKSKSLLIGEIYRVPNTNEGTFLTYYKKLTESILPNYDNVILCGDFNIDLLKCENNTKAKSFVDINAECGLIPTCTKPTRVTKCSATLIDNIFIKSDYIDYENIIPISDLSDHWPILTYINTTPAVTYEDVYSRDITECKLAEIFDKLKEVNWLDSNHSCQELYDQLDTEFGKILDDVCPLVPVSTSNRKVIKNPWITSAILKSSNECTKLYKRCLKLGKDSAEYENYCKYRNMLKRVKRQAKIMFFMKRFTCHRSNSSKVWANLNQLLKKSKNKSDCIYEVIENDKKVTDKKELSDLFRYLTLIM